VLALGCRTWAEPISPAHRVSCNSWAGSSDARCQSWQWVARVRYAGTASTDASTRRGRERCARAAGCVCRRRLTALVQRAVRRLPNVGSASSSANSLSQESVGCNRASWTGPQASCRQALAAPTVPCPLRLCHGCLHGIQLADRASIGSSCCYFSNSAYGSSADHGSSADQRRASPPSASPGIVVVSGIATCPYSHLPDELLRAVHQ
jgi:hypothetical protein